MQTKQNRKSLHLLNELLLMFKHATNGDSLIRAPLTRPTLSDCSSVAPSSAALGGRALLPGHNISASAAPLPSAAARPVGHLLHQRRSDGASDATRGPPVDASLRAPSAGTARRGGRTSRGTVIDPRSAAIIEQPSQHVRPDWRPVRRRCRRRHQRRRRDCRRGAARAGSVSGRGARQGRRYGRRACRKVAASAGRGRRSGSGRTSVRRRQSGP